MIIFVIMLIIAVIVLLSWPLVAAMKKQRRLAKEEARRILADGKISNIKAVDRVISTLSNLGRQDKEAQSLANKLVELKVKQSN